MPECKPSPAPTPKRMPGALAWLVIGYAHVLDRDYAKAIDPLNRAKVHAGDLGDYVDYYLGSSYLQTGRTAEALASLADFSKTHPDSLLVRDAAISYADALLLEGQPAEAVTLLEQTRTPERSDLEFALGRAYAASGQTAKAAEIFGNIYYTKPTSTEADAANAELKKLPAQPLPTVLQLKTRADVLDGQAALCRCRRGTSQPGEREQSRAEADEMELALADALHRSGKNRDAKQVLTSLGPVSGEENAHRLYLIGQVAFAASDNDTFYRSVDELRQAAPASPWSETQALLSAANLHLVHHEHIRRSIHSANRNSVFPRARALLTCTGKRHGSPCDRDATRTLRKLSRNSSLCIPPARKLPRRSIGAPVWLRKTISWPWPAPFTRNSQIATAIFIMPSSRASG